MRSSTHGSASTVRWLGVLLAFLPAGCSSRSGGGSTTPTPGDGGDEDALLTVAFTGNPTGMFAVATDEEGNEYTFFADQTASGTQISEVNARTSDGTVVKATLDENGQPLNLRSSDGSSANVIYKDSGAVKVAVADSSGSEMVVDDLAVNSDGGAGRAVDGPAFQSTGIAEIDLLASDLTSYDRVIRSLVDTRLNPNSPLATSSLRRPALIIAALLERLNLADIVDAGSLDERLSVDDLPPELAALEGTWVLCTRNGFPAAELGIENRLTFGSQTGPHVLVTEFDRQNVFDLAHIGGGTSGGVTINYLTRAPLPPQIAEGIELRLTPVYTATSLDAAGRSVVERRFGANVTLTSSEARIPLAGRQQINAALEGGLIEGEPGRETLTFQLRIIDLENDTEFSRAAATLRYVREGAACGGGRDVPLQLEVACPVDPVDVFDEVPLAVTLPDGFEDPQADWHVISGDAFFSDPHATQTNVIVLDSRPLRVGVIIFDRAEGHSAAAECVIPVGNIDGGDLLANPDDLPYFFDCAFGPVAVGQTIDFAATPLRVSELVNPLWEVRYRDGGQYIIEDDSAEETSITFLSPGPVEVRFSALDESVDDYPIVFCRFDVGGGSLPPPDGADFVSIELTWDNGDDLDLLVFDPFGQLISPVAPHSLSGGNHLGDDRDGFGPEVVEWAAGAPPGPYQFGVRSFGTGTVHFSIVVNVDGVEQVFEGTVLADQQMFAGMVFVGAPPPPPGGTMPPPQPPPPGGGTVGSLLVRLDWDVAVDLDLSVGDPAGEVIDRFNRESQSGGSFGQDVTDGSAPEIIQWASGAPAGVYEVMVMNLSTQSAPFVVTAEIDGVLQTFPGQAPPGMLVHAAQLFVGVPPPPPPP